VNGFWFGPSVNPGSGKVGFGRNSRFGICKLGEPKDWHSILAGVTVDSGITDGPAAVVFTFAIWFLPINLILFTFISFNLNVQLFFIFFIFVFCWKGIDFGISTGCRGLFFQGVIKHTPTHIGSW
jgi:hypothetical protein